eukprot:1155983-Amorphochlora_amoeboformis.AAC.1
MATAIASLIAVNKFMDFFSMPSTTATPLIILHPRLATYHTRVLIISLNSPNPPPPSSEKKGRRLDQPKPENKVDKSAKFKTKIAIFP